jgi:hypothetical protein
MMDWRTKVLLWMDCHTVVIWVMAASACFVRGEYLLALGVSFCAAFFAYLTVIRLWRIYTNATIAGIVAGVEHATKSANSDQ